MGYPYWNFSGDFKDGGKIRAQDTNMLNTALKDTYFKRCGNEDPSNPSTTHCLDKTVNAGDKVDDQFYLSMRQLIDDMYDSPCNTVNSAYNEEVQSSVLEYDKVPHDQFFRSSHDYWKENSHDSGYYSGQKGTVESSFNGNHKSPEVSGDNTSKFSNVDSSAEDNVYSSDDERKLNSYNAQEKYPEESLHEDGFRNYYDANRCGNYGEEGD